MESRATAAGVGPRVNVNLIDSPPRPIVVWENTEQLLGERGCGGQSGSSVGMSETSTGTQGRNESSRLPLLLFVCLEYKKQWRQRGDWLS